MLFVVSFRCPITHHRTVDFQNRKAGAILIDGHLFVDFFGASSQ